MPSYHFLPKSKRRSATRTVFLPGNSEAMAYEMMSFFPCSVWMPNRSLRIRSVKVVAGLGWHLSQKESSSTRAVAGTSTSAPSHLVTPNSRAVSQLWLKSQCVTSSLSKTLTLHVTCDHTRQARLGPDLNLNLNLPQSDLPLPPSTSSPKLRILPACSSDPKSLQPILRGSLFDATMSLKREADPFIKPDPDAKRVKTEGGDGNFSLSSIPMAPPPPAAFAPSATSAVGPKIEGGDRKPLGPVSAQVVPMSTIFHCVLLESHSVPASHQSLIFCN